MRNSLGGVFFNSLLLESGLFQPFPHFHYEASSLAEAKQNLQQTSRSSPQLGSSRATANRLGGKPPRVTNPTMLSQQSDHKCSSYGMALLQLSLALHELTWSLNLFSQPNPKDMYWKAQISQRDVGERLECCSKALGRGKEE